MEYLDNVKSGFFHSKKDPDTGIYDRTWSSEDLNAYFKGVISLTGVFSEVGTRFSVEPGDGWTVRINSGKAVVDGRWVYIDDGDYALIDINSFDGFPTVFVRPTYGILCMRLNNAIEKRFLKPIVYFGPNSQNFNFTGTKPTIDAMLANNGIFPPSVRYSKDPKTNTTIVSYVADSDGNIDLPIGYFTIPASATGITDVVYTSLVGTVVCKYIHQLVVGPTQKDIDGYLADYRNRFDNWFNSIETDHNLNPTVTYSTQLVVGGENISAKNIPLKVGEYTYSEGDIVMLYLNGMLLTPEEYTLDKEELTVSLTKLNYITEPNILQIVVMSGRMFDFYVDGDNIKY